MAAILAGILLLAGITVGCIYLFGGIQRSTANYRGETSKIEKTKANANFRISTYEEFFDLCSSVQTTEAQMDSLNQELKTQPPADRVERINESLTALRNSRAASINTYNSKATQEHREAFHDAKLPARLDISAKETTCAE